MIKYSLYLTEKQMRELKELSVDDVSVSEHIRRAINIYIIRTKPNAQVSPSRKRENDSANA